MPFLKYTFFVGASLLALLLVADRVMAPSAASKTDSTSLDVLRKMANHGELRGFAPLAASGPFLPVPAAEVATVEEPIVLKPATAKPAVAAAVPSSVLNAQARVAQTELIDKPARPEKKAAPRRAKPREVYVEAIPRGQSGGFFGTW